MIPLFLGITLANLIGLIAAAALGYAAAGRPAAAQWHTLVGVLAAVTCCGVHCVVFTYFVATAKWVRHAIAVRSLDPSLGAPTRSFKVQAFPAALAAMGAVFAAAVAGAAADNDALNPQWHHLTAIATIVINVLAAAVEYRAIRRNGLLVDRVLAAAGVGEPAAALEGDA